MCLKNNLCGNDCLEICNRYGYERNGAKLNTTGFCVLKRQRKQTLQGIERQCTLLA